MFKTYKIYNPTAEFSKYKFINKLLNSVTLLKVTLGTHLVHCNDYYMGIGITITMNTLSWNVISITIH